MTRDDRRAALVLISLLLAGTAVRFGVSEHTVPGGVRYRGGGSARAPLDSLRSRSDRLARPLEDGQRVDVDVADRAELTKLPGIGPRLADRIVRDRAVHGSFGSVDGLGRVSGVGPVLLQDLRDLVTFSGLGTSAAPRDRRIAVNSAGVEELTALPGIGVAKASAIVAYRRENGPFRTAADLALVAGIGEATVARLQTWIKIP